MKTKTIEIYEFDELKKDIQDKVVQKFIANNEFECLSEDLKFLLEEELEKEKIELIRDFGIYYNLGYSQGDGFCFEGTYKWKNKYIIITKSDHHYDHKYTTDITVYDDQLLSKENDKMEEKFKEVYYSICDKLEKYGYDIISAETDESNVIDFIQMNEYMFRENGEIENE